MKCEPATTIINILGGPKQTSLLCGVTIHTVIRWRRPKAKGGTGGIIPHWHHQSLIEASKGKLDRFSFAAAPEAA